MSKERARRREVRQREAAVRAAARAGEAERRERRARRRRALRRATTGRLPRRSAGLQHGPLARRRRTRRALLLAALLAANLLVWVVRPDWLSRLAALVVTVLVAPVLAAFVVPARRR